MPPLVRVHSIEVSKPVITAHDPEAGETVAAPKPNVEYCRMLIVGAQQEQVVGKHCDYASIEVMVFSWLNAFERGAVPECIAWAVPRNAGLDFGSGSCVGWASWSNWVCSPRDAPLRDSTSAACRRPDA